MKSYRTLNILSVLVAAMLLASCTEVVSEAETSGTEIIETSETTITETSAVETEGIFDIAMVDDKYAWQLKVILDNAGIAEASEEDGIDPDWYCSYAITDLDRDGYLEILKRYHFSNGPVNKIWIYEVTDDNSIIEINSNLESQNSEFRSSDYPDLSEQPMGVYRGLDGVYRYLVCDTVSSGVNGGQINYGIMSMEDNTFIFDVVLRECYQANESSGEYDYTYFDEDDNEIEEDDYCQRYSEYESLPEDVVHINWFAYITMDSLIESYDVYFGDK